MVGVNIHISIIPLVFPKICLVISGNVYQTLNTDYDETSTTFHLSIIKKTSDDPKH